jgi:hypothetical protein
MSDRPLQTGHSSSRLLLITSQSRQNTVFQRGRPFAFKRFFVKGSIYINLVALNREPRLAQKYGMTLDVLVVKKSQQRARPCRPSFDLGQRTTPKCQMHYERSGARCLPVCRTPPLARSAIIARMCGRYRLSRRKQIIAEHFDARSDGEDWIPRYNVAPTQPVPVIRQNPAEPTKHLSQMRWGLIPSWSKDASACEDDQCEIGNRSNVARIPRCDEIPALPGASRCVVQNDDAECARPVAPESPPQPQLFS